MVKTRIGWGRDDFVEVAIEIGMVSIERRGVEREFHVFVMPHRWNWSTEVGPLSVHLTTDLMWGEVSEMFRGSERCALYRNSIEIQNEAEAQANDLP